MTADVPGVESANNDIMPINGTDYVELYVSNAKQAAYYYKSAFGFQSLAYAGLETGVRDRESYAVIQDKIRLVFTSPLNSGSDIGRHIDAHGDGVKVNALWVEDATKSYNDAMSRGARSYMEPTTEEDKDGKVVRSGIYTYGEVVHVFVERKDYNGVFLPGYEKWSPLYEAEGTGLKFVDHMVGNVELGDMNKWVKFYEDVMGFKQILSFDDNDISTEFTALMSKVMSNGNGRIKFPINEPAAGLKKSQVDEYLEFYEGAGVQHVAMATDNIIKTVTELRDRGVEFLNIPSTYYDQLLERVGDIDEDLAPLRELGILVDRDEEGYLTNIYKNSQPQANYVFRNYSTKRSYFFWERKFQGFI